MKGFDKAMLDWESAQNRLRGGPDSDWEDLDDDAADEDLDEDEEDDEV